eukprot:TRINITY_DN69718_c0_g1_i1.p1 TRINITY_DN69718_c0_g1~~TRINITY_DN69718_c0_g1_i1.p1  ORF type:complete len:331 (-),score=23.06 TRINITY_DN69718_c0_g1_i1:124-1011(-)
MAIDRSSLFFNEDGSPVTTFILKSIPPSFTLSTLIDGICTELTTKDFDYVYLPPSVRNPSSNICLAFVNFRSTEAAEKFYHFFSKGGNYTAAKNAKDPKRFQCRVSPAHIQGLYANIAHFVACNGTAALESGHSPPAVFQDGIRVTNLRNFVLSTGMIGPTPEANSGCAYANFYGGKVGPAGRSNMQFCWTHQEYACARQMSQFGGSHSTASYDAEVGQSSFLRDGSESQTSDLDSSRTGSFGQGVLLADERQSEDLAVKAIKYGYLLWAMHACTHGANSSDKDFQVFDYHVFDI